MLWTELQTNKKYRRSQSLTSKYQALKRFPNCKDFFKNCKYCKYRSNIILQQISYFPLHSSFLSIYLHKSMHKKRNFH